MTPLEILEEELDESNPEPLVVQAGHRLHGYSKDARWGFDFWDLKVYDFHGELEMGVKVLRRWISPRRLQRIIADPAPLKVILIEKPATDASTYPRNAEMWASHGIGVFVRGVGWVSKPYRVDFSLPDKFSMSAEDGWRLDPDGTWVKDCSKCGFGRPKSMYRKKGRGNKWRADCNECVARRERENYARKKGLTFDEGDRGLTG